jgi:hypothetical protein
MMNFEKIKTNCLTKHAKTTVANYPAILHAIFISIYFLRYDKFK